jgi:hypothetical protein
MKPVLIAMSLAVLGVGGQAQAQEPGGHIDLGVVSGSPILRMVTVRVGFAESGRDCPEDQEGLRILNATLFQIATHLPTDPPRTSPWQATWHPSDDETQFYRIWTPTCRTDITVREQARRDGSWTSLLVPKGMRPSTSHEESVEIQRRFMESVRAHMQTPEAREEQERFEAADEAVRSAGSLKPAGGVGIFPFGFDNRPQACFEAVGDYRIEQTGVTFFFMTGLPGDLNRFTIERSDPDPDRGRIFFTRGDCRFELTISQSVLQNDAWLAVPLADAPR